jgi:hypothetical protein
MSRRIHAGPARGEITLDGVLNEADWRQTEVVQHFFDHQSIQMPELETDARVLWTADALYVSFRCQQPGANKLAARRETRDTIGNQPRIEVFVDPRGDGQYRHYMIDLFGNVHDERAEKQPGGRTLLNKHWDGAIQQAVARDADGYTVELRLPAADLGRPIRPRSRWRLNLCRDLTKPNGKRQSVAAVHMPEKGFHQPDRFPELRLLDAPLPPAPPLVDFVTTDAALKQETIETGTGTAVAFNLHVDTNVPLHDATLTIRYWHGDEARGVQELFVGQTIPVQWRSKGPVQHAVDTPVKGLEAEIFLEAREGRWTLHRLIGQPPARAAAPARFVPGVDGQATVTPFSFAPVAGPNPEDRIFDVRAGTLEFWFKPEWPATIPPYGKSLKRVLVHQGPLRWEHPHTINYSSVVLECGGGLSFRFHTAKYKQRAVRSSLPSDWLDGQFHHVALQWQNADGQMDLVIFLDGKKRSGKVEANATTSFRKEQESFPIHIGSDNKGIDRADGAFDQLRVSRAPRYAGDFTPARKLERDGGTTLYLGLDG